MWKWWRDPEKAKWRGPEKAEAPHEAGPTGDVEVVEGPGERGGAARGNEHRQLTKYQPGDAGDVEDPDNVKAPHEATNIVDKKPKK